MHGTIIHYDSLTQCGLLRTASGQLHYFRHDEVITPGPLATGLPITLRNGVLVDTGGSQFDPMPARRPDYIDVQVPLTQAVILPDASYASVRIAGWIGTLLAGVALVLLLLSGGQQHGYVSANPRLVGSIWGTLAAVMLVIEALFFVMSAPPGVTRRRVRRVYWAIVWLSAFAYVGQTFDGFEADDATGWYAYALLALGFAVYILPYRSK